MAMSLIFFDGPMHPQPQIVWGHDLPHGSQAHAQFLCQLSMIANVSTAG